MRHRIVREPSVAGERRTTGTGGAEDSWAAGCWVAGRWAARCWGARSSLLGDKSRVKASGGAGQSSVGVGDARAWSSAVAAGLACMAAVVPPEACSHRRGFEPSVGAGEPEEREQTFRTEASSN